MNRHLQVLVNLPTLPILPQQPPKHPHPPKPSDLGRHPSLGGTLTFTVSRVTAETFGGESVAGTSAGVDDGWLDDADRRI